MSGSGKWWVQYSKRNCGTCPKCRNDSTARPHGPYTQLRRRNPEDAGRGGQQEYVYLGRMVITDDQLALINEQFTGPDRPTRDEVVEVIAETELL